MSDSSVYMEVEETVVVTTEVVEKAKPVTHEAEKPVLKPSSTENPYVDRALSRINSRFGPKLNK